MHDIRLSVTGVLTNFVSTKLHNTDVDISAVHCWVSSKSMHVTDRQTDRQADGQNYDSQDRTSIAASRGENLRVK